MYICMFAFSQLYLAFNLYSFHVFSLEVSQAMDKASLPQLILLKLIKWFSMLQFLGFLLGLAMPA